MPEEAACAEDEKESTRKRARGGAPLQGQAREKECGEAHRCKVRAKAESGRKRRGTTQDRKIEEESGSGTAMPRSNTYRAEDDVDVCQVCKRAGDDDKSLLVCERLSLKSWCFLRCCNYA